MTPNDIANMEEEITLKELIQKIIEFCKELWSKKWWIVIITIPFLIYFGYKAKTTPITYKAVLTYTLSDGGGGGGGISGILGSFGLGKAGKVNLDKIVELSKSRNIIQKVLFSKVPLDTLGGKTDFIANHLIVLYELDKIWAEKNPNFEGFRFKHDSIKSFTKLELNALKMVFGKMVGGENVKEPVFTNGFSEDTGILSMSANSVDEELSILICEKEYYSLKKYYEMSSTKIGQNTFNFVEQKKDSIFNSLQSKKYELAKFNDSHRNLTDPKLLVEKSMIETDIQKLILMYGEVTKNYEIADFSLESSVPDINIIDEPLPPLDAVSSSIIISLIKGGLLGGLLAVGFFVVRKIVHDALAK